MSDGGRGPLGCKLAPNMKHVRFDFTFAHNYEARILDGPPPVHPLEKLYHFPIQLEEGDRTGTYVRVAPQNAPAWTGFFALGFNSDQVVSAICSCPDPDSVCVAVGGYAYVVKVTDPTRCFQIEQRPVVDLRVVPTAGLILFTGFTSITAVGNAGIAWQTERLSWEGLRIDSVDANKLQGFGWDAISDKEVAFEVELQTGKHTGGARPGHPSSTSP
jgi:hypothetical protein